LPGPTTSFSRGALRASAAGFFFEFTKSCQNTRIGLATKIEEYVPTVIPITKAKEKPLNTSPPKKNSESAVSRVRPLVKMVRLRVWLTLRLMMLVSESRREIFRFSRESGPEHLQNRVSIHGVADQVNSAATTVSEIFVEQREQLMVRWCGNTAITAINA
jgi:hypothetical protein